MSACFHCNEKIDGKLKEIVAITPSGDEAVCCLGCKAVTEHIYNSGLSNYYEFRTEPATRPSFDNSESDFHVFEDSEYVRLVSDSNSKGNRTISLAVDGIHCAACSWLIEQALKGLPGLLSLNVNTINQRAFVEWDDSILSLAEILRRFSNIGYPATPFKVSDTEQRVKQQEKQFIKRLGVAGLFTMQIMMVAIATYFGAFSSMEIHQRNYFNWISLLLCLPVIFYSAIPFLKGAIASVKSRRLNMDVPVSIAIYGAFSVSFYQLVTTDINNAHGEVFFESIAMFTFLLLIGKYLEFRAKSKAQLSNANLSSSLPSTIIKIDENDSRKTVLVKDLIVGDRVYIKPGEHVPIDGVILVGRSELNESVLTGEFTPILKTTGDKVLAGSVNTDGGLTIEVTAVGAETALAEIGRLHDDFSQFKPQYSHLADRIAHWFVFAQLVISVCTYAYWSVVSPADALWISLSVLVATCPCALSLATPTAYTCILSTLSRAGILIKDPVAFDRLNTITDVVFDKTGTITEGRFTILSEHWIEVPKQFDSKDDLLATIALIQQHSEHPIARAFERYKPHDYEFKDTLTDITTHVGLGISASISELKIKIGSAKFCGVQKGAKYDVYVTIDGAAIVGFLLDDEIKTNANKTIENIRHSGQSTHLLTGDNSKHVDRVQETLNFDSVNADCTPEQKAQFLTQLQENDKSVMMIGDGINDAPVFAAADVGIAMASGADISKQAAQIIIVNNRLSAIEQLFSAAKRTQQIIKQNLQWALAYNLVILPIAICGFVPPYVAVIGMSASSIIVVSNSLRLLKK